MVSISFACAFLCLTAATYVIHNILKDCECADAKVAHLKFRVLRLEQFTDLAPKTVENERHPDDC